MRGVKSMIFNQAWSMPYRTKSARFSSKLFCPVALLIFGMLSLALADNPPPDDPPPDGADTPPAHIESARNSFGAKFRKIALNGLPLSDEKPQSAEETDYAKEESYVDAMTLALVHNTTDIYIDNPSTELPMQIRRSAVQEISMSGGLMPHRLPTRPFGPGWQADSLAPCILMTYNNTSVTDVTGESHQFSRSRNNFHAKVTTNSRDFFGLKLVKQAYGPDGQQKYIFTKRFGLKSIFSTKPITFYVATGPDSMDAYSFFRLEKVEDKYGNYISYNYDEGNKTCVPDSMVLTYKNGVEGPSLWITKDSVTHLVTEISVSGGTKIVYEYTQDPARVPSLKPLLTGVKKPKNTEFNSWDVTGYKYTYNAFGLQYQQNMVEITDPRGKTYKFEYGDPHIWGGGLIRNATPPYARPLVVSKVIGPDNTEAIFEQWAKSDSTFAVSRQLFGYPNDSEQFHELNPDFTLHTLVRDFQGNTRIYDMDRSIMAGITFVTVLGRSPYLTQNFITRLTISYFNGSGVSLGMDGSANVVRSGVTTPIGYEQVIFDHLASMAPKQVRDFSGNVTNFENGDSAHSFREFNVRLSDGTVITLSSPQVYFSDVTKQTNALGGIKTFEYEGRFRQMKKITDEEGVQTEYVFDSGELINYGRRRQEKIKNANGDLIQQTDFDYDATFPGFMTRKRVKRLSGDTSPSDWAGDLVVAYEPDEKGRLKKEIVDPEGLALTTTHSYDDSNRKVSTTDPRGNTTTFDYDIQGRLVAVHYPGEVSKSMAYDARGNKIRETDENGHSTLFEYDAYSRVARQARDMDGSGTINAGDLITVNTYNSVGSKTGVTDPKGKTTNFEFDAVQRMVKKLDPPLDSESTTRNETNFEYGVNSGGSIFDVSSFKPTRVTDPEGYTQEVVYDSLYRPTATKVQITKGTSPVYAETSSQYDAVGNLIVSTDPLGWETKTDYDALKRPTVIRYAKGTPQEVQTSFSYTSTGLKWRAVDELGRVTDTEYDAAGRPTHVIAPEVAWTGTIPSPSRSGGSGRAYPVTKTEYDGNGNIVATINPLGSRWEYVYDVRNRKIEEVQPKVADANNGGTPTSPHLFKGYDGVGNVVSVTDARGNSTGTEYDVANRPYRTTGPGVYDPLHSTSLTDLKNPITTTTYDPNGNVLTVTDPNGHVIENTYDALNRLVTTTQDPGSGGLAITVTNEYDAVGNKTAVQDGNDQRTEFTYNGLKRNTSVKDPAGKTTIFDYDGVNKIRRTDALGQVTEYKYDARNRLTGVDYSPTETFTADRSYTYDLVGNLLSVEEDGTKADVSYTYDELKRQTSETSGGLTHTYVYDLAGNRVKTTYGGTGRELVSTYDALNRLHTLTESERTTAYQYDLAGNVRVKTLPEGDLTVTAYDALNRRTKIEAAHPIAPNTNPLYTYEHQYDLVGNLKRIVETYPSGLNNRTVANTYDKANRLTVEAVTTGSATVTTSYIYDKAHNRTEKEVVDSSSTVTTTYAYNSLNQLTQIPASGTALEAFTYDYNGNRTAHTKGGQTDTYSYDFENRLVGLEKNISGTGLQTGVYAYIYDYRTRRVERDEHLASGDITKLVFSGGTSVQEYTVGTSTTLAVEYLRGSDWGGGVGGILYSLRGSTPSYTHYNSRGDVTAKTNGGGTFTYQATYEAYGKRTQEQGSTDDRQKANTKDEDPTGLLNEGFRYRDLDTGTFITRDPLGFVDGPNMYAFVVQNPWTHFDPEGLAKKKDYEKNIQRLNKARDRELRDAKRKSGESKEDYKGRLDDISSAYEKQINANKEAINKIEETANAIQEREYAETLGESNPFTHGLDAVRGAGVNADTLDDTSWAFGVVQTTKDLKHFENAVQIAALFLQPEMGAAAKGTTSVYSAVENGVTQYVGITDNLTARAAAHLGQKGIVINEIPGLTGLARADAKAVEQVLIETHGLGKNGGTLLNKINSISPNNPIYNSSILRGQQLLRDVGYPGF